MTLVVAVLLVGAFALRGSPTEARAPAVSSAPPVAGDGHELAHSGPPMSRAMLLGCVLVTLGAGTGLAVLFRSRQEG
ncbi:hypothetical protein ACFQ2B_20445 [Streptomyces stramineus]